MSDSVHLCPHCQQELEYDESMAGMTVECPSCTNELELPSSPQSIPPKASRTPKSSNGPGAADTHQDLVTQQNHVLLKGTHHAKRIFSDFKSISFREEIVPIDNNNIQNLMRDYIFWAITLLGIIPLLIVTVTDTSAQLTMFALFFAFVWGAIFKIYALKDNYSWKLPLAALFFTGIVGVWLLLTIYEYFLPEAYLELVDSSNPIVTLVGFVLHVGLWEEITKALPILIVLAWKRSSIDPKVLVTIGVFSGLGFAAFENLHYGDQAVISSYLLTRDHGAAGLVAGVQGAMIVTMLRAISLVFCHAVWSGIVGYFIATAFIRKKRVAALIIMGILVSATLHGVYNWFAGMQPTVAALLAGMSFALFYGYLAKLHEKASMQPE